MRRPGRLTSTLLLAVFLAPIAGPAPHASADGSHGTSGPERAGAVASAAPAAAVAAPVEAPADDCCTTFHEGCAAASCAAAGCGLTPVAVRDLPGPERDPDTVRRAVHDHTLPSGPAADHPVPPPRV